VVETAALASSAQEEMVGTSVPMSFAQEVVVETAVLASSAQEEMVGTFVPLSFAQEVVVETAAPTRSALDGTRAKVSSLSLCAALSVAAVCVLVSLAAMLHSSQASCASLECPQRHVLKENALYISCAGRACVPAVDLEKCCEPMAVCSTMACPPLHIPKENSTQIPCAGATCTEAMDLDRCCERAAVCLSMECPPQYVKRSFAVTACAGRGCTIEDDLERCCESLGSFLGLSNFLTCPSCQLADGLAGLSTFFFRRQHSRIVCTRAA
jgi:hypothetical protein